MANQPINSDAVIKEADKQETINSDAKVVERNLETITSDATIQQTNIQETINSDAEIVAAGQKLILSDATIKQTDTQRTIDSNAQIVLDDYGQTIKSDASIKHIDLQEAISSDANIKIRVQQTLDSDSQLWGVAYFESRLQIQQYVADEDFEAQIKVNFPTPLDPTSLVASDPETGEAIKLTWVDSGNYSYNIYKDVGGTWVEQNEGVMVASEYLVGGLTTGVTYTFMVRGANANGSESTGVSISGTSAPADTTPSYDVSHYLNPDYEIKVDGTTNSDLILERVDISYGPEFSTASFYTIENPTSVVLSPAKQVITVYINSRLVFTGYLVGRTNVYNSSELKVTFEAISKLWDYVQDTTGEIFNEEGSIDNSISIRSVLRKVGCPWATLPSSQLYGEVDVRDQTPLNVMTDMLNYAGNYKIYTNPSGEVSYYQVGSPIYNRTLELGKHIISQNITTNIVDLITDVTVYSSKKEKTTYRRYNFASATPLWHWIDGTLTRVDNSNIRVGDNGELSVLLTIDADQISNVKVYARINKPPRVDKNYNNVALLPTHIKNLDYGDISYLDTLHGDDEDGNPRAYSSYTPSDLSSRVAYRLKLWEDGTEESKFSVYSYQEYSNQWEEVGANVVYNSDNSHASIKVPAPISYKKVLKEYTATFITTDETSGDTQEEDTKVWVMLQPEQYLADIMVVYTYKQSESSSSKSNGTGGLRRTYHENVTPYDINTPGEIDYRSDILDRDNSSDVLSYIGSKAQSEIDKSSFPVVGGSLTTLGDETLDLRTQVNGYEVMRVVHDFSSGDYITQLDLTNVQYYRGLANLKHNENKKTGKRFRLDTGLIQYTTESLKRPESITGAVAPKGYESVKYNKPEIARYAD